MKRRLDAGFTLIEMLIVIAILSILIPVMYKTRTEWNVMQREQAWQQQATWALQSQADLMRSLPFRDVKAASAAPFGKEVQETLDLPEGTTNMRIASEGASLRKIALEVGWLGANGRRQTRMLTFYRYGI